jgi:serine/threonine-protein kinase
MEPEKIGQYKIEAELGRGGMATVYRGYDPRFEREVAVKVLPREMLHDPQFRVRFEREAKTIAQLEHPFIVPVYDVGEDDGQPYFVMRYMDGGSLSDRLKNGPLPIPDAAMVVDRMAAALDAAHAKGIIHRDLKPGNVLFDRQGEPYLSDFGIAKLTQSSTNVTGSGIIGTPTYMSPEQAQGEKIDGRSDIYTLGVILFEMLTGKRPYEADTPMGVVVKHITEPVPHILDANPNLPPATEAIIAKAMAKNRNQRFSTGKELAEAVNALARGETPDLSKTSLSTTRKWAAKTRVGEARVDVARPRSAFSLWLLAIPVVLVLAVVGGVLFVNGGLPFGLVAPTARSTQLQPPTAAADTPTLPPAENPTTAPVVEVSPAAPTDTPAAGPSLPVVGGADKIAFIRSNEVWVMNVDGSDLKQLTNDGAAKSNLQWLNDRNTLVYITGKCAGSVNLDPGRVDILACFNSADVFDGFRVSPDGKWVAISLSRELFVVPFDLEALKAARTRLDLLATIKDQGCLTYHDVSVKDVRWSADGKQLAFIFLGISGNRQADLIRVMDISRCSDADPLRLDEFPGSRFTPTNYSNTPLIPDFDWDGSQLFLLNSFVRNEGFGDLYSYNTNLHKAQQYDPVDGVCCYRDARWSPDGSYVAFAFQDIRQGSNGSIQLYYVPFGTLGTGASVQPLPMPFDFFTDPRGKPQFALRPAQ